MEVSSLDSPGASSGYCSGTEEEPGFTWDCMGLETGSSPDRLPASGLDLDVDDVCSSSYGVTCCEPEVAQIRDLWDEISDGLDRDGADSLLEPDFRFLSDDLSGCFRCLETAGTPDDAAPCPVTPDNWDAMFSEEEDWRNLSGAGEAWRADCLSPLEFCQEPRESGRVDVLTEESDESSIAVIPDFVDLFCRSLDSAPFDISSDVVVPGVVDPRGNNGARQEVILCPDAPLLESSGGHEASGTISGRFAVKHGEQIPSKNIKPASRIEDRIAVILTVPQPKRDDFRMTSRSPKPPMTSPEVTPRRRSVLEALLKTSGRLSPNQGSNAILCREIERRGDYESGKRNTIQQQQQQQQQQQRSKRIRPARRHRSSLLHNLLTCRTDETERGRGGTPQSGSPAGKGRVEADRGAGSDVPQNDPTAYCDGNILFDGSILENRDSFSDLSLAMPWLEDEAELDEPEVKTIHLGFNDDVTDSWFTDYFAQTT